MRSYLILSMCVLFLIYYFIQNVWIGYFVVLLAITSFIGSALNAKGFPRIIGILMMGTGIILEIYKGTGAEGISQGILMILPLLCLVTLAPLLSIPLKLGGYFESIDTLLRNLLHHPRQLFAGITTSLFILSPILSLGSVRILSEFLSDLKLPTAMSAKSYLIGFSTAIMWSPYFASVSLVLYYLDMEVGKYIVYGIGLSFLSLIIGNGLFALWERRNPLERTHTPEVPLKKESQKQLILLGMFVTLLLCSSLTIEYLTKWSMIIIVCMISILLPIAWGLITKGWHRLIPLLKNYRDHSVPMMSNEIMLFTSAGLFAHAVQGTTFANIVSDFLTGLAKDSILLFAVAVIVIVVVVTYLGLHQIAVIAALAMQLKAEELGISNLSLAMLLLLSWSISSASSPFSGLNLMVSKIVGISGFETGIRANGLHLAILTVIGLGIIMIIS
ncbi:TRAP transporter large permease subunit [Rossellomorea aquimaris]|uniref:TRAP transporter large permease subunit n=1 Tax=Rossellomorea aquimaris TaxID=189382 RepID=A0A5D4TQE6_9BACI|nr:TRAP transporter large permease subunit [Rossellomorea aquimaris]TYS77927.1 TRAP transporter large permease subunit [Rossellomorea aquimaris]TYS87109.1 TRAP transporter large permease subunit [Rossellomorea aquimaris]